MRKIQFTFIASLLSISILFSQSTEYKINELMSAYAENGQYNGTVLIQKGGRIVYEKAFGLANREWNINNTLDSKFKIGSISKSITAFMTLMLVNEGLINLNATINDYIPDYSGPGSNKVTIHQMLTHTSGIPDHGAIPNLVKKRVRWIYNSDEYLELIKDLKLKFEPGTGFCYSGIAYNILAIICEKVTHKDFAELLNERLFKPLKMYGTKYDKNEDVDSKLAYGYEYHLLEGYLNPSYIESGIVKGSGAILSTIEDLAKFNEECFIKHTLLSKELYDKMFTSYIKDWQYYGYGWWITDQAINNKELTLISHGGSTDGYKAYNTRIVQDSIDIIFLQNDYYRTELGVKFEYNITNEIIDVLYGKRYSLPKKSIAKDLGYIIGQEGIKVAISRYDELEMNNKYFVDENELNQLANELYRNYGLKYESIGIFDLALKEYPESFILNYSYAKLLSDSNTIKAKDLFKRCVDLYTKNSAYKKYSQEYNNATEWINEKK